MAKIWQCFTKDRLKDRIYKMENTIYKKITPALAKERLQKLRPEILAALGICGRVFSDCLQPWAIIGSNALILAADTQKAGDDIDIIFADGDYDKILDDFQKLETAAQIEDLKLTNMVNFKNDKNGCRRICGLVRKGDKTVSFEAYSQNTDAAKIPNGIINLGLEKETINIYPFSDADGKTSLNFLGRDGVEELYFKNLLNEFSLYDLNGWLNKKFLKPKALERLSDLISLGLTIQDVINRLDGINAGTEIGLNSKKALKNLWEKFSSLPLNGTGLLRTFGDRLELKDDRYRLEKIASFLTKEIAGDLEVATLSYKMARINYKIALRSDRQEDIKRASRKINSRLHALGAQRSKYAAYKRLANNEVENDFCLYAALSRLEAYFFTPIVQQVLSFKINMRSRLIREG
jgi:hypothetical protein